MTVGGCIVDSGNFDWEAHADKFPGLTTPDESYHGIIYTKKFGKAAYITKATAQMCIRDSPAAAVSSIVPFHTFISPCSSFALTFFAYLSLFFIQENINMPYLSF